MDSVINSNNDDLLSNSNINEISNRNIPDVISSNLKVQRSSLTNQQYSINQNQIISNIELTNSTSSDSLNSLDQTNTSTTNDDSMSNVVFNLATSGLVGMAAANAILSSRRRNKNFKFESNPSIRRRLTTRLCRKMQSMLDELSIRAGQQAVLLLCTPRNKSNQCNFTPKISSSIKSPIKIYGTSPLLDVLKNNKSTIIEELENSLMNSANTFESLNTHSLIDQACSNSSVFELPPLTIDGIPTSLDKMTQAQLRTFIPGMLRSILCRGKPGWGRIHTRPVWWPNDVPWANVRNDIRSEEDKKQLPWTTALKKIVRCCYQYYGREDLLDSEFNGPQFLNSSIDNSNDSIQGHSSNPARLNVINHSYPSKDQDNPFNFIQVTSNPSSNNMHRLQHCQNANFSNRITTNEQDQNTRLISNNYNNNGVCRELNEIVVLSNGGSHHDYIMNHIVNQKPGILNQNRIQSSICSTTDNLNNVIINSNLMDASSINRIDSTSINSSSFTNNQPNTVYHYISSNNSCINNQNSNPNIDRNRTANNNVASPVVKTKAPIDNINSLNDFNKT